LSALAVAQLGWEQIIFVHTAVSLGIQLALIEIMAQLDFDGVIAITLVLEDIEVLESYGHELDKHDFSMMWKIKMCGFVRTGCWENEYASDY